MTKRILLISNSTLHGSGYLDHAETEIRSFLGGIVEMDLWDRDAIDLVGPGFIEFLADGSGRFGFIAVDGYLDCRQDGGSPPRLEFTWKATTKATPSAVAAGAQLEADGSLRGHIYFHNGDDSGFLATRQGADSERDP